MKIDAKYVAFHVLTALYFIWFILYASLIAVTLINVFGHADAALNALLQIWIMLNFIMGAMLFIALSLYKNSSRVFKAVMYSFGGIAVVAIVTLVISKIMA